MTAARTGTTHEAPAVNPSHNVDRSIVDGPRKAYEAMLIQPKRATKTTTTVSGTRRVTPTPSRPSTSRINATPEAISAIHTASPLSRTKVFLSDGTGLQSQALLMPE